MLTFRFGSKLGIYPITAAADFGFVLNELSSEAQMLC